MSGVSNKLYIHEQTQIYLPEPASLQDGEGAAKELQNDVASVEDLQEGNDSLTKDSKEQELMYVDVQHTSAMEVVEEKKSCNNKAKSSQKHRQESEELSSSILTTGVCYSKW